MDHDRHRYEKSDKDHGQQSKSHRASERRRDRSRSPDYEKNNHRKHRYVELERGGNSHYDEGLKNGHRRQDELIDVPRRRGRSKREDSAEGRRPSDADRTRSHRHALSNHGDSVPADDREYHKRHRDQPRDALTDFREAAERDSSRSSHLFNRHNGHVQRGRQDTRSIYDQAADEYENRLKEKCKRSRSRTSSFSYTSAIDRERDRHSEHSRHRRRRSMSRSPSLSSSSRSSSSDESESEDDDSRRHSKRSRRHSRSHSRKKSDRKDRHGNRERSTSRERRKRRKEKGKGKYKDKDKEERRSILTGKKIKLKVKKDKGDHERDKKRRDLLTFLNSACE